jgi:hypothetical protein
MHGVSLIYVQSKTDRFKIIDHSLKVVPKFMVVYKITVSNSIILEFLSFLSVFLGSNLSRNNF